MQGEEWDGEEEETGRDGNSACPNRASPVQPQRVSCDFQARWLVEPDLASGGLPRLPPDFFTFFTLNFHCNVNNCFAENIIVILLGIPASAVCIDRSVELVVSSQLPRRSQSRFPRLLTSAIKGYFYDESHVYRVALQVEDRAASRVDQRL